LKGCWTGVLHSMNIRNMTAVSDHQLTLILQ